jgi:Trypsin-like peptidase domain
MNLVTRLSSLHAPVLLLLGLLSFPGCGASSPSGSGTSAESDIVVGTDDQVVVNADGSNLPSSLRALRPAIGFLNNRYSPSGGTNCSAVHIGNGWALTAGHCITPFESMHPRSTPDFDQASLPMSGLTMYYGRAWGTDSSAVRVVDYEFSPQRDYAILRLQSPPAAAIPARRGARPAYGAALTMLSFPDPNHSGIPSLTWSQACTFSSALGNADLTAANFMHDCDDEDGSSGAGAIDVARGEVVGINDGWDGRLNYGTALDAIPLDPYLDGLQVPRGKLTTTTDGFWGAADRSADVVATLSDPDSSIASIEFQIVPDQAKWEDGAAAFRPEVPVVVRAAPPWTAHFDTSGIASSNVWFTHVIRAVVTSKNGATSVLESKLSVTRR